MWNFRCWCWLCRKVLTAPIPILVKHNTVDVLFSPTPCLFWIFWVIVVVKRLNQFLPVVGEDLLFLLRGWVVLEALDGPIKDVHDVVFHGVPRIALQVRQVVRDVISNRIQAIKKSTGLGLYPICRQLVYPISAFNNAVLFKLRKSIIAHQHRQRLQRIFVQSVPVLIQHNKLAILVGLSDRKRIGVNAKLLKAQHGIINQVLRVFYVNWIAWELNH